MVDDDDKLEETAGVLLAGSGLSVLDAARITRELCELVPPAMAHEPTSIVLCRHIIRLGAEAYEREFRTVSFREAVEQSLLSRAGRRIRTLAEVRQYCRRLLLSHPELADMPVRHITPEMCREFIMKAFATPPMRRKARCLLHGIFAFSLRHGWCAGNPLAAVDIPPVRERPIEVLGIAQLRRLLETALQPEHRACAPAMGLMLWAGIRPTELTRLRWADIHFEDRVITIEARHAKTGGARQVTLYPVLVRWLRETAPFRLPKAYIVPRGWRRRWAALRQAAGFADWHPDVLRHTFASYHLKHFKNYNVLQIDMGHVDTQLLRTRYLGMKGITARGAAEFWGKRRAAAESGNEGQQA